MQLLEYELAEVLAALNELPEAIRIETDEEEHKEICECGQTVTIIVDVERAVRTEYGYEERHAVQCCAERIYEICQRAMARALCAKAGQQ